MTITTVLAVTATTFGVVMGLSPLLQVRTILRRHSSADVSLGYLLVLLVGLILWLAYGIAIGNAALIIANAVSILTYALTIVAVVRFRRPRVLATGT